MANEPAADDTGGGDNNPPNGPSGIKATPNAVPISDGTPSLEQRVGFADSMIAHIARHNISIADEVVRRLLQFRATYRTNKSLTEADEKAFLADYFTALRAIRPATPYTILDSQNFRIPGRQTRPPFLRTFVVWLSLLLFVQIEWIYEHTRAVESYRLATELNAALLNYARDHEDDATVKKIESALDKLGKQTPNGRLYCIGNENEIDTDNVIVHHLTVDGILAATPKDKFDVEAACIRAHFARIQVLNTSMSAWGLLLSFLSFENVSPLPNPPQPNPVGAASGTHWWQELTGPEQNEVMQWTYAQVRLEIISKYFLAILYGLLGATTFALRSIWQDINDGLYSETSKPQYWSRIAIGAVSGLVIAWFVPTGDAGAAGQSTLATLSPFALAFLGGYSVELLFALMDRFVRAFTK
jgi:hypothetical protein